MARIKTTSSKNSKTYSIIEDYCRNGKRTTKVVEYIGCQNKVNELAEIENLTVEDWLKNYLNKYKKEHNIPTELEEVIIKKYSNKLIPKNIIQSSRTTIVMGNEPLKPFLQLVVKAKFMI